MSSLRGRSNRFKPKSEIVWLDHAERKEHRNTIKILADIAVKLEGRQALTSPEDGLLRGITDSTAEDTRLNAAWNAYEKTELAYTHKLAAMAPHDLTAYHEMMNPDQAPAKHHILICEKLMQVEAGEIMTLIIATCPGSAKTSYASKSFAQWALGRNPNRKLLGCLHTQRFGEGLISKPNRDAIASDLYRLAFPDVFLGMTDKAADFWKIAEPFTGQYAFRGVGSGVSGIRSNLTIADDLYPKAEEAMSQNYRDSAWQWWVTDILSRNLPNCPIVLSNTLWHAEDVASRTKEMHDEAIRQQKDDPSIVNPINTPFEFVNIPAEAGEDDPLGRAPGEWLWCKEQQEDGYYPISHYEQKRASMPPSLWSALYLGVPLDKHGDYVSEDDFQYYDAYPVNEDGKVVQFSKTVMSVDTSQSSKERADNTAILVFRHGIDNKHYLVDCWAGVRKLDDLVKVIQKLMNNWNVNYCIMENSGMGVQLLENYQGKFTAPLVSYTPAGKGSKDFRFDAAVPNITTGKILFPKTAPWLVDLINEFVAFPNGAKDDRVDAFAQYADHSLKNKIGGVKRLTTRL